MDPAQGGQEVMMIWVSGRRSGAVCGAHGRSAAPGRGGGGG